MSARFRQFERNHCLGKYLILFFETLSFFDGQKKQYFSDVLDIIFLAKLSNAFPTLCDQDELLGRRFLGLCFNVDDTNTKVYVRPDEKPQCFGVCLYASPHNYIGRVTRGVVGQGNQSANAKIEFICDPEDPSTPKNSTVEAHIQGNVVQIIGGGSWSVWVSEKCFLPYQIKNMISGHVTSNRVPVEWS